MIRFLDKVAFPKLGISVLMDNVAFTVFGKEIYWYGIIIALAFVLAVGYALWRAPKIGLTQDNVYDCAIIGLPISIICARAFYVLGDMESMQGSFMKMIAIWDGGMSIYGAIIGFAVTGVIYSLYSKINLGRLADFAVPCVMMGQAIGRWGNFVNCEVYGGVTNLPWGMQINGRAPVHPLFLYESLWMLLGLVLVLIYQNKKKRHGEITAYYLIWYSGARAFLETLRDPEYVLVNHGIAISFWMAILTAVVGVALLVYLFLKTKPVNLKKEVALAELEKKRLQYIEKHRICS